MNPSPRSRNWKIWLAAAFAAVILSSVFTATVGVKAQSGTDVTRPETSTPSGPYATPQYATLTATTNTINATMVPVVNASGATTYQNLTIPLVVTQSETGALTVTAGTISAVPSPFPSVSSFQAGTYLGPGASTLQSITLSGPGAMTSGATEWGITMASGANGCYTYPQLASFYVGPISSSPLYARLKKAGISSSAYSYGIAGNPGGCDVSDWWLQGALVGVTQVNGALTIVSFTYNGVDQATPGTTVTYTLQH